MSRSTSGGGAGDWAEPPRSRRSGRAKSRPTSNFRSVSSLPVSSALMRRGYRRAPARRNTAQLLPASEVVIVPAAGHLPWHEQPGCVADALSRLGDLTGEPESVG